MEALAEKVEDETIVDARSRGLFDVTKSSIGDSTEQAIEE